MKAPAKPLRACMGDLSRWSEGDGELVERLKPGATLYEAGGKSAFGDGFSVEAASGSYHVAAVAVDGVTYLVTSRTWLSGYDEWEAAGRPSGPDALPQHGGCQISCVAERDWGADHRAFAAAAMALHRTLDVGARPSDAIRDAAFSGVEDAMRRMERLDLRQSGMPDWLVGASEEDEGPVFGR